MEASGTPTPPADQPPPPPPPAPAAETGEPKATIGWRLLAVLFAIALGFAAAVMILIGLNPDDTPRCDQVALALQAGECFDVTKTQQTIQAVFAWPSGIIGAVAAIVALMFAATGRRGALMMRLAGAAIILGVIAVVVGQF
jgi:hypothetical protein